MILFLRMFCTLYSHEPMSELINDFKQRPLYTSLFLMIIIIHLKTLNYKIKQIAMYVVSVIHFLCSLYVFYGNKNYVVIET